MICQDVVRDTMQKLEQGVALSDIRKAIDERFRDRAHLATPSPVP
jgi:hypothetical protein